MTTAWLMTGSIATLLPRYMKKTWVGKQLMGKDLWFFVSCSIITHAKLGITELDFALFYSLTRTLAVASRHDDQGVGLDRGGFCPHLHRRGRLGGAANQPERASANRLFGNRYDRCSIYSSDAMTDNMLLLGLTFIQPFMAAFRPAPNAAKRFIFNWAHSIVGYSAHALASNASTEIICLNKLIHLSAGWVPLGPSVT
jgi:hypothetical protein